MGCATGGVASQLVVAPAPTTRSMLLSSDRTATRPRPGHRAVAAASRAISTRAVDCAWLAPSRTRHAYRCAMKQHVWLAVIFIIGCATGGVASQLVVPPVRAGTNPTRWEYLCAETTSDLTTQLSKFGPQGWELVSMFPVHQTSMFGSTDADHFAFCLKRPLP
jgi:hypothetical protein